jgi:hypothetical protein
MLLTYIFAGNFQLRHRSSKESTGSDPLNFMFLAGGLLVHQQLLVLLQTPAENLEALPDLMRTLRLVTVHKSTMNIMIQQ